VDCILPEAAGEEQLVEMKPRGCLMIRLPKPAVMELLEKGHPQPA
jgi:hypothetical protein